MFRPMNAARPGFGAGIKALWGGVSWLAKTPDAWPLAAVPIAIGIGISGVLTWLSIAWVPALVADLIGPTSGTLAGIGAFLLKVVSTLVAILLAALFGFSLAQPLSGSALEALVRRKEKELGGTPRPPTSFWFDVWCSLQSLLVSYARHDRFAGPSSTTHPIDDLGPVDERLHLVPRG